jgi:hypothetical protein
MINTKSLIISILLFSGCGTLNDDPIFLQSSSNLDVDSLNFQGYYYNEYEAGDFRRDILFLYKNGIVLYGHTPKVSDLAIVEEEYKNGQFYDRIKDVKFHWGAFTSNGKQVEIQRWVPSEVPYKSVSMKGEILDKETFVIKYSSDTDQSNPRQVHEVYKFHPLNPKPDSTNTFIK